MEHSGGDNQYYPELHSRNGGHHGQPEIETAGDVAAVEEDVPLGAPQRLDLTAVGEERNGLDYDSVPKLYQTSAAAPTLQNAIVAGAPVGAVAVVAPVAAGEVISGADVHGSEGFEIDRATSLVEAYVDTAEAPAVVAAEPSLFATGTVAPGTPGCAVEAPVPVAVEGISICPLPAGEVIAAVVVEEPLFETVERQQPSLLRFPGGSERDLCSVAEHASQSERNQLGDEQTILAEQVRHDACRLYRSGLHRWLGEERREEIYCPRWPPKNVRWIELRD